MSTNGDLVENPTGFSATKSINFDLEKLRQMTHSEIYVETGLGDVKSPVGHVSSCETALMCGFLKILGIELVENFCGRWKYNYTEQINNGRFKMVNDDAINLEKHLAELDSEKRIMFFLDACVDSPNIRGSKKRFPILEELQAISKLERKDHIIIVNHANILELPFPWGEVEFSDIKTLEKIKDAIKAINERYQFVLMNGLRQENILVAFM